MLYFTIFECLSQIRNCIFNVICCGSSDNQWYTMKGSCSFWWYWWICWPSLFREACSFWWYWWNCWPSLFREACSFWWYWWKCWPSLFREACSFWWYWWKCWPSLFREACSFWWYWWNCWPSLFREACSFCWYWDNFYIFLSRTYNRRRCSMFIVCCQYSFTPSIPQSNTKQVSRKTFERAFFFYVQNERLCTEHFIFVSPVNSFPMTLSGEI